MNEGTQLRLAQDGERLQLTGSGAEGFVLVNDYLGYLADRNYSPRTGRAYGYDLLAFCRWLLTEDVALEAVTTEVLLELRAGKAAGPGRVAGLASRYPWPRSTPSRYRASSSGWDSMPSARICDPMLRPKATSECARA